MASIKIDGLEQYQKTLEGLSQNITGLLKRGVYDGAAVVADAVRSSISSLPSVRDSEALADYNRGDSGRLSDSQKKGLLNGLNLSQMQDKGGFVDTKLSFGGYNSVRTKKYPKGQPNIMIAASVESGTSARQKQPFMRSAVNRVKGQAKTAMEETVTSEINNLMEGK